MRHITLALGSNHFLHRAYLRQAIRLLKKHITDMRISSLYETTPVGETNGGNFFNLVLQGTTDLSPVEIFEATQSIEKKLGRTKVTGDIAREIDIDIIFYDNLTHQDEMLMIPHPRRTERDFVLQPLIDLDPQEEYIQHLSQIEETTIIQQLPWITYTTKIVGILNITPDSFSDGQEWTKEQLHERITELIHAGADIIDIGAESTAPGSKMVSEEEEGERLAPVFELLQEHVYPTEFSLDTTKAHIANMGIEIGCTYINDVSGGRRDPDMLSVIASHPHCTYIMMYAKNENGRADLLPRNTQGNISETIETFFNHQIEQALLAGIQPKQLILDPGMGAFISPDWQDSINILQSLDHFKRTFELPLFVGTSRKGFLKKISPDSGPNTRVGSSLASSFIATQYGAEYIRVHDVQAMKQFLDVYYFTSHTP